MHLNQFPDVGGPKIVCKIVDKKMKMKKEKEKKKRE